MTVKSFKGKEYFDGDGKIYDMDPRVLRFDIMPSRPANLLVTIDPDLGTVNAMAGTFGPCTWVPMTVHLHFNNRVTSHTYYNLRATKECVLALPGRNLVRETWITNLPTPRGINELEVANLTPIPSRHVKPPGIKECPVNLECVLEMTYDIYLAGLAVVRIVGGNIDKELVSKGPEDRAKIMRQYPLYETDSDYDRGVAERFGLMGDLIDCPVFPISVPDTGFGKGGSVGLVEWMTALKKYKYITDQELNKIINLFTRWEQFPERIAFHPDKDEYQKVREDLTNALRLICWEKWKDLHKLLSSV